MDARLFSSLERICFHLLRLLRLLRLLSLLFEAVAVGILGQIEITNVKPIFHISARGPSLEKEVVYRHSNDKRWPAGDKMNRGSELQECILCALSAQRKQRSAEEAQCDLLYPRISRWL